MGNPCIGLLRTEICLLWSEPLFGYSNQANGSFCLCDEGKAEGLVINGKVYHVEGLPEIEGAETVSIVREDDGIYAANLIALLKDLSDLKNAEQFRKALQIFAGEFGRGNGNGCFYHL